MRLKDVTPNYYTNKIYKGKYKKFERLISYLPNLDVWHYHLNSNDERNIMYSSLWDGIEFKTQEDCIKACQKYIDEVLKNAKISKKMG